MRYKSIIAAGLLSAAIFTGCKDEFADINTNPSSVSQGNVPYLFTKGLLEFEPSGYLLWYYNAPYTTQWVQAFVPNDGFKGNFTSHGALGDQGSQTYKVMKQYREVVHVLSEMNPEDAAKYTQIKSMFYPLMVYLGLFDSDMYGDMPYTEAVMAPYTSPMLLTPKYDTVESLYDLWLTELNTSIDGFLNAPGTQIAPGKQDFVYNGDMKKWAKFSNSLKLKIAARLINVNKAKALEIVNEAANNKAGFITSSNEDFIYNRATDKGDEAYHFGDNINQMGTANKDVVDFLLKNWDPRVRFFYGKNDYNSRVVQAFYDGGVELPAYIAANVEHEVVNSKKVFKAWKGMGEPWVRYYGIPSDYNAGLQGANSAYFDKNKWQVTLNGITKEYIPTARFNEELVRGRVDYTFPDAPGATVVQDKEDNPWYGLFISAAEVNLYLAEFKLLGATLPETAEAYYSNAVKQSVKAYDNLARLNKIPYYSNKFDDNEEIIALQDGEVDKMMEQEDYKLTGTPAEQLEKVYIQQYLHFMYQPNDQFVNVRRSGVPQKGSKLIAWKNIAPEGSEYVARRFDVSSPSPTDLMYQIKLDAYKRQGFTMGNKENPHALNTERLWQDKNAPQFGEGPKN